MKAIVDVSQKVHVLVLFVFSCCPSLLTKLPLFVALGKKIKRKTRTSLSTVCQTRGKVLKLIMILMKQ